jgi:hypothetical protein
MKKIPIYIAFLFCVSATDTAAAQPTSERAQDEGFDYQWPVAEPVSLSANYGELRPNHIHAGLDIRVGGVPGRPVVAVADGYVSRIKVSATGYGNALYIAHPNGTTSVYAHLHAFAPAIKSYIENIQYALRRFAVDEYPEAGALPVKKGETIGTAGNSGSSLGAHLHFEIRETQTQTPLNVFAYDYYPAPPDRLAPTFRSVAFFAYREIDSIPCIARFYRHPAKTVTPVVKVPDTFFIGIDAFDTQDGTPAKLAVYRTTVALDNDVIFSCRFSSVAFDRSLYVNSAIAYDEWQRHQQWWLKTYIEPGNRLPVYDEVHNNGLISLPDTLPHRLEITATDDAGNTSSVAFTVQRKTLASLPPCDWEAGAGALPVYRDRENRIVRDGLEVTIPAGALYRSIRMAALDTLAVRPAAACSPAWTVHSLETPLHYPITLTLAAALPDSLQSKALIAVLSEKGTVASAGGRWRNGAVTTDIRSFGCFFVAVDTVAPVIRPQFAPGARLHRREQLKIKITDNLSGIATYSAYIDNQWALFEYDAKNHMLIYRFDGRRLRRNCRHQLLLTVTDNKQNTATLQTSFLW